MERWRSVDGSRFTGKPQSVTAPLHLQGLNSFRFVIDACFESTTGFFFIVHKNFIPQLCGLFSPSILLFFIFESKLLEWLLLIIIFHFFLLDTS